MQGRSVELDVIYSKVSQAAESGSSKSRAVVTSTSSGGVSGGGISAAQGQAVVLSNAPFYYTSTTDKPSCYKSGTFYFYDGLCINGRYRMTNKAEKCGELPIAHNVTGWVPLGYCGVSSDTGQPFSAISQDLNKIKAAGQIGGEIESLTYVDVAADNSDSIEITVNATDSKWINDWFPDKGTTLSPKIVGRNWASQGDTRTIKCGKYILDDISYSDSPSTLQINGVSKPNDTDFSELEREYEWKNTSIKRIGGTIAGRYGLGFKYDADDYDIECDSQDGTDSSYYNDLCKRYGLILKVYASRLWVYDREKYKEKKEVASISRFDMKRGSFSYNTTLVGTFTGGYFDYTDADKDSDIHCSIGGGKHTKSVSRRATDLYDASVQLCAELNNANHSQTTISFTLDGAWSLSAGNNIKISGLGKMDGKYFIDKVTHKVTRKGGFESQIEASLIQKAFHHWDVGGTIEYKPREDDSNETYTSTYEVTSPAANAESKTAGAVAGDSVNLNNAPFYRTSTTKEPACYKSGTFYYYDGILINGKYRITSSAARCGKLPVGHNVTGWVPASYCNSGQGGGAGGSAFTMVNFSDQ